MQKNGKNYKKGKIGDRFRVKKIDNRVIKEKNKKEYTKIIVLVLFLLTLTLGTSYAFFTTVLKSEKTNIIVAGIFDVEFKDGNEITLNNAFPMSDTEGMTVDSYKFSIENKGNVNAKYNISLEENITDGNVLDKKYIKYSYKEGNKEWSKPALLSEGLTLEVDKALDERQKVDYEIKMWLDEAAPNETQGKTFSAKIVVSSVQNNEDIKDIITPVIKLNGETVVNVTRNSLFVDPGVSNITDNNDTLNIDDVYKTYEYYDGENTVAVNGIDTSRLGVYYIYYKVKDSEGNEGCTVRTVNVYDVNNSVPTITLNGSDMISINAGDEYIELSATAIDNEDGNITDRIVTVGNVNTKVVGTYVIKYIVEDSDGNTASVVRTVTVNKRGSISINVSDYATEGKEINVPIEIVATDGKVTGYYVSKKNDDSKPQEKDYQEIDEEVYLKTFTFNENGTYYIWAIDSNYNVTNVSIDVKGVDNVKPSCEFSDVSYIGLDETTEIELICTDNTDVEYSYLLDTDFIVDNEEVAFIESVSGPERVEKGYKYVINLKGLAKGEFTISLKPGKVNDVFTNANNKVSKKLEVSQLIVQFASYNFQKGEKEQSEISYTNKVGELIYSVEDPSIATIDETGFVTGLKVGTTYVIVSDSVTRLTTRIPITIEKTLVVTYKTNGIGVTRINDLEEVNTTCKLTSESPTSCEVEIPYFTVSDGYSAVGFSQNKNATIEDTTGVDGYVTLGNKVSISENTSFYTITKLDASTYIANFNGNGASLDGNTSYSCTTNEVWNVVDESVAENNSKCNIVAPNIIEGSNTDTPIVVGFTNVPKNDEEAKKATEATLSSGGQLTLSRENNDNTWYAVTKSSEKVYTATYDINEIGLNVDETKENIKDVNTSCTIKSSYNGSKQADSCTVVAPLMVANNGYSTLGWSQNENATTEVEKDDITASNGYIKQENNITLKGNVTLYSIFKKKSVTLTATFRKNGYAVDEISSTIATCSIEGSFNGGNGDGSCTITVPNMQVKDGYTKVGWSKNPDAKEAVGGDVTIDDGYIEVGDTLTLTEDVELYSISKKDAVTYTATFKPNGSLLNDKNEDIDLSCTIEEAWNVEQANTCTYEGKTPTISREGFNIIGFDPNKDALDRGEDTIASNSDITLDSNKTYYAISNKLITISWVGNGATISSNGSSCTIYNNSNECLETITVPSITREGYTIKGWNTDENAHEGDSAWEIGTQKKLTIDDSSKTLYAITEKTIDSTLNYYDDETGKMETTTLSCKIYNNQTEDECNFDVPEDIVTGKGPLDTEFKEYVQDEDDSSKYYALYESEVNATFNYYNGEGQVSVNNNGVRSVLIDSSDYVIKEGKIEIPDVVKNSKGINDAVYKGVSKDINNTTSTDVTTANTNYYAYYENTVSATFNNQNSDVATLGIATNNNVGTLSCESSQTSNGVSYTTNDCEITLPAINVSDGYIVTGWNTDKNALEGSKNTKVKLNSNTTYYTIIGKPAVNKTATFYINGAGTLTNKDDDEVVSDVDRTCTIEEVKNIKVSTQPSSCTIITPKVTGSVNTPIVSDKAYATSANAIMGTVDQNSEIAISGGEKYYAITYNDEKTRSANFYKNGSLNQIYTLGDDTITSTDDVVTISCKILKTYNGVEQAKSCSITTPRITATANTPNVIGYSKSSEAHQKDVAENSTISLEENINYYAQTKNSDVKFTINDYKIGKGVSSIGDNQVKSCTIDATYNGVEQAKNCDIEAPTITSKKGYTTAGWSLVDNDTTGVSIITLNKDNTGKDWYANAVANAYTIEYYDGDTKKGSSSHKVGSIPFELTTANELGLSKTGYKFKGWATSNGGDVVYTNGQSINEDLATDVGEVIKLYAVWKDEEKPVCSFSGTPTTTTQNTATLTLTCTDNGSGISSQDLSTSNFTTDNNGEVVSVSSPTEVIDGFSYIVTVRGLSVGEFKTTLNANSIRDNSNNYNDAVTSDNTIVNGRVYTVSFIKGTGVKSISSTSASCTTVGSSLTCSIDNYPTITPLDGYVAGTWYDDTKDVDTGITSGGNGASYLISENTTMKAQTKVIPTITMNDIEVTYTGDIITHSATSNSDGNITYKYYSGLTCGGSELDGYPINVGDYSVEAIQEASGNYTVGSKCAKIQITKATGWVELETEVSSVVYGTDTQTFKVSDTHGGKLSVSDNNDNASVSISGNTVTVSNLKDLNAGTEVIITVTSAANDNYKSASATHKLSITSSEAKCPTSITGYTDIYDGKNHGITVSSDAVGGTIQYSADNSTWSSTKPTFKNADTYTTYVRVKADSNHGGTSINCGSKDVKIEKATITVTPLSNQNKVYGEDDPELKYSVSGVVSGEEAKFTGSLTREAGETVLEAGKGYKILQGTLALADNDPFLANNYNLKFSTTPVNFTINAKSTENISLLLSSTAYVYDGTAKTPTVTVKDGDKVLVEGKDYTVSYANNINANSMELTPIVTVTLKGNYSGSRTTAFTINKRENTLSVTGATNLVFGSTENMVSVKDAQGDVYYSVGTKLTSSNFTTSGSKTIPTAAEKNAGTYIVYYYTPGDNNNQEKDGSVSVTIAQADNLMELTSSSITAYVLSDVDVASVVSNAEGNVTYAVTSTTETTKGSLSGGVYTTGSLSTSNDNNGKVVVTVTAAGNTNYKSKSLTYTITVQKYTRTLSWSTTPPDNLVYGDKVFPYAQANGSGGKVGGISYSSSDSSVLKNTNGGNGFTARSGEGSAVIKATLSRTSTVKTASISKTVTASKRKITCTTDSASKTYDGEYLTKKSGSCTNLASDDSAVLNISGKIKNYGTTSNTCDSVVITNTTITSPSLGYYVPETTDVTSNYDITISEGTLSITKRDLTVTPLSNQSKVYGASDPELKYSVSGVVSGEEAKFTGSLTREKKNGDGKEDPVGADYKILQGTLALADNSPFLANNYDLKFSATAVNFAINAKGTENITVTLSSTAYGYDGTAKTPTVTVKDGSKTLVKDTDYTVSYANNINAGTATVTVTLKGNYSGTITKEFKINPSSFIGGSVTISGTNTWGNTLTANVTNTTPTATYGYQWYYNANNSTTGGTAISGATSSTYAIDKAYVGKYIYVVVTASKTNYNSVTLKDITDASTNTTATVAKKLITGGSVTISGTNTWGNTLTATTTDTTPSSKSTYKYQWYYNSSDSTTGGTAISGATSSTYTISSSYVGKYIYVVVTTGLDSSLYINKTLSDKTDATNNTTAAVAQKTSTLSLGTTNLSLVYPNSGTSTYSYDGDGTVSCSSTNTTIATCSVDTTNKKITVSSAGVGSTTIKVSSSETDYYKAASKSITVAVTAGTISGGSVKISGTNTWGNTLTANVTNTTPTATYSYQWYYSSSNATTGGTAISGATSSTYTISSSYVGKYIYVVVTASKTNYNSVTLKDITDASTNTTATVAKKSITGGSVTISGTNTWGSTLTATTTDTTPSSKSTYKYQWYYNSSDSTTGGTAISGATSSTYTISSSYVGKYIYVVVTTGLDSTLYINKTLSDKTDATNNTTATVAKKSITGGSVKISGTNTWGSTLTATTTDTTPSSKSTYKYQWYYNSSDSTTGGTAISGATSSTYTISSSYVGKYIYVVVTTGLDSTLYINKSFSDKTDATNNTTATVAKQAYTTGSVTINGINTYQNTLYASTQGTPKGTYKYQWYSNTSNSTSGGKLIYESTNFNEYTIEDNLVGNYIYVVVTVSGNQNYTDAVYKDKTDATNNRSATVAPKTKTITWKANGHTLTEPTGCTKDSSTGNVTCSCTYGNSNGCSPSMPDILSPDDKYVITNATFSGDTANSQGTRKTQIYYVNTSGSYTSKEISCDDAFNVGDCSADIPSEVTNSKYNSMMSCVGFSEKTGSTSVNIQSSKITLNKDSKEKYYAVYKSNNQSVKYYTSSGVKTATGQYFTAYAYSNGSKYVQTSCTDTSSATTLVNTIKSNLPSGYVFNGLSTSVNSNTIFDDTTSCRTNSTLYAVYSKTVKATYYLGSGVTQIGSKTSSYSDEGTTYYLYQSSGNYSALNAKFTLPSIKAKSGYSKEFWESGAGTSYSVGASVGAGTYTAYAFDTEKPKFTFDGITWNGRIVDNKLIMDSNYGTYNLTMRVRVTDNNGKLPTYNTSITTYCPYQLEIGSTSLICSSEYSSNGGSLGYLEASYSTSYINWRKYSNQNIRMYIVSSLISDGSGNYTDATYIYAMPLGSSNSYYTVY